MMSEEDVPVVLPNLNVAFNVDVIVQAAVDEIFAATRGKVDAAHWNASVVRDEKVRAFLLKSFHQPSQQTDASGRPEVFRELIQLVRIENVKTTREVSFGLSLFVEPVKVL